MPSQEVTMPDDDVMGAGKALPTFEEPEPPIVKLRRYLEWCRKLQEELGRLAPLFGHCLGPNRASSQPFFRAA